MLRCSFFTLLFIASICILLSCVAASETELSSDATAAKGRSCFGIAHDEATVCSSHGTCVDNDKCLCRPQFAGDKCEIRVCQQVEAVTVASKIRGCQVDNPATSCADIFSQNLTLPSALYYIKSAQEEDEPVLVYCDASQYNSNGGASQQAPTATPAAGDAGSSNGDSTEKIRIGDQYVDSNDDAQNGAASQRGEVDLPAAAHTNQLPDDVKQTLPSAGQSAQSGTTSNSATDAQAPSAAVSTQPNAEAKPRSKKHPTVNTTKITVTVPRHMLKYNLQPKVISHSKIVFLDAQDISFYERQLKKPSMTIWLLTSGNKYGEKGNLNYSSKRFFETAWKMNIQLKIMLTHHFDLIATKDGLEQVSYMGKKMEKKDLPDAVMPRLGAKMDYFGMSVVRHFEKAGILVLNNHASLDVSKDKLFTIQALASHQFPIPKTMFVKFPVDVPSVEREFKYPFVLKKASGTHGKGVMLVKDRDHFDEIKNMVDQSKPMIIQEFISHSKGRDIRVIVVGGKAIGAMMRVARKGFRSNYHQGGYVKPIKLTPAIEWLATEGARAAGLDIAGVDILIDEHDYKICEINASPGFQGFELATGVNVPLKVLSYAQLMTNTWKMDKPKKKKKLLQPVEGEHIVAVAIGPNGEQQKSQQKAATEPLQPPQ